MANDPIARQQKHSLHLRWRRGFEIQADGWGIAGAVAVAVLALTIYLFLFAR